LKNFGCIFHFAEDHNANLIAMGIHGLTGIAHVISGSVAENIVNHSKRQLRTFSLES